MLRKTIVYLLPLLFLFSCGRKNMGREEAVRSLKVLNSDFTNFFSQAGEIKELRALRFLWDHDAVPLPFPQEKYSAGHPWKPYDFTSSLGVYRLDSLQDRFLPTGSDSVVRLLFSTADFNAGEFVLEKYRAAPLTSRPDFPLELIARLHHNDQERLVIAHTAEVADDLPLHILSRVTTSTSEMNFSLDRTRDDDNGSLVIRTSLAQKGFRFIDARMNALIGYSAMGYYFNDITFTIKAFDHLVDGTIHYGEIDPTARDYAHSFNSHSEILIMEMPGRKVAGQLILAPSGQGDLLDYFIRFSDGHQVPVNEYLPFLNQLLNMKI